MNLIKTIANRVVRGIRGTVPGGYLLGRTDSGEGSVQLVEIDSVIAQAGQSVNAPAILAKLGGASGILDKIDATQGDILYRGASAWEALAPGTSGQVLTTGGAAADPSWADASGGSSPPGLDKIMDRWPLDLTGGSGGGGGGGGGTNHKTGSTGGPSTLTADGSSHATKGTRAVVGADIIVYGIGFWITAAGSGETYVGVLAPMSGSGTSGITLTAGATLSDNTYSFSGSGTQFIWFTFDSGVQMNSADNWYVGVSRTDSTTTAVNHLVANTGTGAPPFPGQWGSLTASARGYIDSTSPSNGDSVSWTSGATWFAVEWDFQ